MDLHPILGERRYSDTPQHLKYFPETRLGSTHVGAMHVSLTYM